MTDIIKEISVLKGVEIQNLIYTIRGVQVMLDRELAELYCVDTKVLNQAVKRNIDRFPEDFRFQLTTNEKTELVTNCDHLQKLKYSPTLPYVFTEQGVAMLSGVLRSDTAVKVSIRIMNAFVSMRKFMAINGQLFQRVANIERKQIESDEKFEQIFKAIEEKEITPKQGIFFEGQIFDAHRFVSDIIRSAKKSIAIIDNYVDDTVLTLLTKRKKNMVVTIYTKTISKRLALDVKKYNAQYPAIHVRQFDDAHDRFIIIDDKEVYHLGASLKDLGKKWFAFSKFDTKAFTVIEKLKMVNADG